MAIDLDENIKDKIFSLYSNLDIKGAKLVEKENLHITLRFFGDSNEIEIIKKLKMIKMNAFEIEIHDIGAFPNERFIRVLWVGVHSKEIYELIEKINNIFGKERFEPHITIARIKTSSHLLSEFIKKNKNVEIGKMVVRKIVLKKSTLTPTGPIYENIEEFELNDNR